MFTVRTHILSVSMLERETFDDDLSKLPDDICLPGQECLDACKIYITVGGLLYCQIIRC